MPDLCQQDDLARYAPADQCQPYEHEAHEADRLAPEREDEDQSQREGQAAHREHQPHPPAAFLHRVAAPCLACDTGHQRDERRADTGDAEHDASRHDMRRERSQREEQDAPHPCPGGYGRHDEDQQRTLPAGEACGVDREGAVARVLGDQAEPRRGGGRRRDARRDEPQPADYMPRDERPGHVRLDDEKPADDRHGGDRIADGREKVFRGGGIGADDLADDGGGGAIERDADRAQEKEYGACREPRGVVAGGENVGAVGETEGCHRKRNGAEEDAYAIVHNRSFCYAPACKS